MAGKSKKMKDEVDENPYNRRSENIKQKAFKSVEKSVKPVYKGTNKTRRVRRNPAFE